jgi:hypothetical protein
MYLLHIPSFNSTYLPMYLSCKFPLIFHHEKCGKISLGLILLRPRQSNIRILLNVTLLSNETKSYSYCLEFFFFSSLEPLYNIATLHLIPLARANVVFYRRKCRKDCGLFMLHYACWTAHSVKDIVIKLTHPFLQPKCHEMLTC